MEKSIYICDDTPIDMENILPDMTEEEIEAEFKRLFGE